MCLILQSAVLEVQNRSEVRLSEERKRTDNELLRQRTTFSQESIEWQRHERAEMGKLRSEQLAYLQSTEQYKIELVKAQQSLKLEQDKYAQAHLQLVDLQTRLNASDFYSRQLQSDLAERDARIQQLDQQIAGASPAGNV